MCTGCGILMSDELAQNARGAWLSGRCCLRVSGVGIAFGQMAGFVLDRAYRGQGIGGAALEEAIRWVWRDFGVLPIALGVHRENVRAEAFYRRHGFRPVDAMEGEDVYWLRYPDER